MSKRDFYQPIIPGGGNYRIIGPRGPMVQPRDGGLPYPFVPRSRGHGRDQRFISTYRLGRDAGRNKYRPNQGVEERARRQAGGWAAFKRMIMAWLGG